MTALLLLAVLWIAAAVRMSTLIVRLFNAHTAGWADPAGGWRRVLDGGTALTAGIVCIAAGLTGRAVFGAQSDLGVILQHVFFIAGGCAAQILGLTTRPGRKAKSMRRRMLLAGSVATIYLPLYLMGASHRDADAGAPMSAGEHFWLTLSYIPYDLYLAICLIDIAWLCFANAARGGPVWRVAGLRCAGLGGAFGAFSGLYNLVVFTTASSGHQADQGTLVTQISSTLAALFFACGVIAPPVIDLLVRYRRGRSQVRLLRAL